MSALRLVFLPRADEAPRVWRVEGDRVVDRREGLGDLHADLPIVVVVPGEATLCRWLELPGGRDVQSAAAAGFLLEDELAQPRETLHTALGPRAADGRRLAVLADRERMEAWLDAAAVLPRLDGLIPDCLLAPAPEDGSVLALHLGPVWLLRAIETAMTVEPDLLPLVAAEPAPLKVEEPAVVEAFLVRGARTPVIDLRQGAFAPPREGEAARLRTPILLAALVAVSVLALPAVQAVRHALATRAAVAELKTLSGVSDPDEAVARLGVQLGRLQAGQGFPAQAAAVFGAVERIDGMELQSLLYDETGAFRISAAHANYSDVEALRAALRSSGLGVEESSAQPADGRIVSDFMVRPLP